MMGNVNYTPRKKYPLIVVMHKLYFPLNKNLSLLNYYKLLCYIQMEDI